MVIICGLNFVCYEFSRATGKVVLIKANVYVKKNTNICQICVPQHFLIRNRAALYGLCGKRQDMGSRRFFPNVPQFGERSTFSWQKVPQSGKRVLYKTADCGGAIKVRHFW